MAVRPLGEDTDLPPTVAARIDEICDRFEADWTAGRRPPVEEVLEAEPAWRIELLGHLLAVELSCRRRRGERPTPEEYRARFPGHADLIGSVFHAACSTALVTSHQAPDWPAGRALACG